MHDRRAPTVLRMSRLALAAIPVGAYGLAPLTAIERLPVAAGCRHDDQPGRVWGACWQRSGWRRRASAMTAFITRGVASTVLRPSTGAISRIGPVHVRNCVQYACNEEIPRPAISALEPNRDYREPKVAASISSSSFHDHSGKADARGLPRSRGSRTWARRSQRLPRSDVLARPGKRPQPGDGP